MTAEPVQRIAASPLPEYPAADELDPRKLVWGDVRRAIVTGAQAAGLAVTELARRPADAAALEMAGLTRAVLESALEMARRWVVDEAVLEAERERAYAAGAADCKAARCRLSTVRAPVRSSGRTAGRARP
jgi:hypothetical protein